MYKCSKNDKRKAIKDVIIQIGFRFILHTIVRFIWILRFRVLKNIQKSFFYVTVNNSASTNDMSYLLKWTLTLRVSGGKEYYFAADFFTFIKA